MTLPESKECYSIYVHFGTTFVSWISQLLKVIVLSSADIECGCDILYILVTRIYKNIEYIEEILMKIYFIISVDEEGN